MCNFAERGASRNADRNIHDRHHPQSTPIKLFPFYRTPASSAPSTDLGARPRHHRTRFPVRSAARRIATSAAWVLLAYLPPLHAAASSPARPARELRHVATQWQRQRAWRCKHQHCGMCLPRTSAAAVLGAAGAHAAQWPSLRSGWLTHRCPPQTATAQTPAAQPTVAVCSASGPASARHGPPALARQLRCGFLNPK